MSLFSNLRSLFSARDFPLEDFHTEVVAQVLKEFPEFTKAWLLSLDAIQQDEFDSIGIQTQVELPRLDEHEHFTKSRPDIIIRCNGKLGQQIIIVESKVESRQGKQQLKRYADHLARLSSRNEVIGGALVFITKHFQIFEAPTLDQHEKKLCFRYKRWFHFYRELCAFKNSDALIQQLKLFMKDNQMSTESKFDLANILCLQNWHATKSLMDETLDEEVNSLGQKILETTGSLGRAIFQLRNWNRYVLGFYIGKERDIECLIGYWPEESAIWIGCMLYSNPNSKARDQVIVAFRKWIKLNPALWEHDHFDDPQAFATIFRGKDISQFDKEKDQVRAIKDYFLEILEEVRCFRDATPDLPWTQAAPAEVGE